MNAESFVHRLAAIPSTETLCNFYADTTPGAAARREALTAHLTTCVEADLVLVGEAPGYRGARLSGVAFTSQHQLLGAGPREATATAVHAALAELGLSGRALLWNVVPFHPHEPGKPDSNRTPTSAECSLGRSFLQELTQGRRAVAVGRIAQRHLPAAHYVRHPARGGAPVFASQLAGLAAAGWGS